MQHILKILIREQYFRSPYGQETVPEQTLFVQVQNAVKEEYRAIWLFEAALRPSARSVIRVTGLEKLDTGELLVHAIAYDGETGRELYPFRLGVARAEFVGSFPSPQP
jgi:hypothetical protein